MLKLFFSAIAMASSTIPATADVTPAENPPADPGYRLVWADEFEGTGKPDPTKWKFEKGFVRNQEWQYYQEDNAWQENGRLIIEGRRERVKNPQYDPKSDHWGRNRKFAEYTSASLMTDGLEAWTYGRFEVRARFQPLPGLWPAIWSTGVRREGVGWPHTGEIDVMEFYKNRIYANFCWAGPGGQDTWNTGSHSIQRFDQATFGNDFHLWVMEWSPEKIDIYLDGQLLNRQELKFVRNMHGPKIEPFHHGHALRLNLALGSSGGDPATTSFPQRYEVDFVRVWQRADPETSQAK